MKPTFKQTLLTSVLLLSTSPIFASGFKIEISPSVLGDGGDAAVVEDAGTNWYNAAGDVDLPQEFVASVEGVGAWTKISGTEFAPNILGFGPPFVASGSSRANNVVGLPALHYVYPFANNNLAFGISLLPAWGLMESYGSDTIVRYNLDSVYSRSIIISPSFSARLTSQWSIGLGPDFHYWYLSEKVRVRTEPVTPGDSISRFATEDWAYGGHIGVLFRIDPATRVGLNYRSRLSMNMDGYSDFIFDGISAFSTNLFHLNVQLPASTALSIYRDITPCWAIMGTIAYDQWSIQRNLRGVNFIGPTGALATVVVPVHFNNTFDFSIGTHYSLNNYWMLRAALKYQQTPTRDRFRNLDFPDSEKLGVNIGAHYQMTKKLGLDAQYTHVFTATVPVNITNVFGATVRGNAHTPLDLLGAQVVYDI